MFYAKLVTGRTIHGKDIPEQIVDEVETRIDDTHVIVGRFASLEVGKWMKLRLASMIRMSSWVDLRVSRSASG
jgi:hypothetical protein